jgi:hypothetical protein
VDQIKIQWIRIQEARQKWPEKQENKCFKDLGVFLRPFFYPFDDLLKPVCNYSRTNYDSVFSMGILLIFQDCLLARINIFAGTILVEY